LGTYRFSIEGKEYHVEVGTRTGNQVEVTVNGKTYKAELAGPATPAAPAPAASLPVSAASPATPAAAPLVGGGSGEVRAPISGLVLSVAVSPGQKVTAGTSLLVLEAMKMENEIFAPIDGVVENVLVRAQQQVGQGDLLLTITPS
jgi:biotin carboxyl carrier protein